MITTKEVGQSHSTRADVLVKGLDGRPVAVVEVKNRPDLRAGIAASIRRNLITHGMVNQSVPYFLLVSQDAGFLWDQRSKSHPDDPPAVEFSMEPVVGYYVRWLAPDTRLDGSALEFVVANWLADQSIGNGPAFPETTEQLAAVGFLEAVEGAMVSINERT